MIKKSEESEAWLSSKTPEPSPNPLVRPMFREEMRAEGSPTLYRYQRSAAHGGMSS